MISKKQNIKLQPTAYEPLAVFSLFKNMCVSSKCSGVMEPVCSVRPGPWTTLRRMTGSEYKEDSALRSVSLDDRPNGQKGGRVVSAG